MLIQIAILAWIFPGEGITLQVIILMAVAGVSIVLVQMRLKDGTKNRVFDNVYNYRRQD